MYSFLINKSVYIIIFLFPVLIATVQSSGGILFIFLFLLSLINLRGKKFLFDSNEQNILLGFLVLFIMLLLTLSYTSDIASGVKKLEKVSNFILFLPMYYLLRNSSIESGERYYYGIIVSSIVMFVFAVWQSLYVDWWVRIAGAYDSLVFGDTAMLMAALLFCALITVAKSNKQKVAIAICIIMAISTSVMSGARGSWLLLPVLIIWLLWVLRKKLNLAWILVALILGLILVYGAYSSKRINHRIGKTIERIHLYEKDPSKQSSISVRMELWRDSIKIWSRSPIIGAGIGSFHYERSKFIQSGESIFGGSLDHAHNIFFDMLANAGIVGLIAFVYIVFVLPYSYFSNNWKKSENKWVQFYALSGMTIIVSFVVFGLTEGWLSRNPFVRLYLMSILVFLSSIAVRKSNIIKSKLSNSC